jgi:signal transduction histidine kinase
MPDKKPPVELATLLAGNIHEVKNLLGQLFLGLDEAAVTAQAECPKLAQRLVEMRMTGRRVHDRLLHILTVYKAESGFFAANLDAYDPAEIIEDLALEAGSLAATRLNIETSSLAPASWYFDRYLVESALTNALHNSLRHAATRIRLSAREEDGYLVLSVEDDGKGYPRQLLDSDEQPLHNGSQGSTGLGLYFSRTAAAAHRNRDKAGFVKIGNGGTLGGAVFSLWLP